MPEKIRFTHSQESEKEAWEIAVNSIDTSEYGRPLYVEDIKTAARHAAEIIEHALNGLEGDDKIRFIISAFNARLMLQLARVRGYTPLEVINNGKTRIGIDKIETADNPSIEYIVEDAIGRKEVLSCTYQEFIDWLEGIRSIYLDELIAHTSDASLAVLLRSIDNRRIWELTDGLVLKLNRNDKLPNEFQETNAIDYTEAVWAGLEQLYKNPERHPNICYNLLAVDNNAKSRRQLQKYTPMDNLLDALNERRIDSVKAIEVLQGFVQGINFLRSIGLRISDLHPSNIGISPENGRALVFDMDSLIQSDAKVTTYPSRGNWMPPRWQSNTAAIDPALMNYSDGDAIYELGKTLALVAPYITRENSDLAQRIDDIADSMTRTAETDRPSWNEIMKSIADL